MPCWVSGSAQWNALPFDCVMIAATIDVTLDLYSHVVPSLQKDAAKQMRSSPIRLAEAYHF